MIASKIISAALFVISSVSALTVMIGSDEIWTAGSTHDVMITDKDMKNDSTVRIELWNRHGEEAHKLATLSDHAVVENDYAHVTIPDSVVKANDAFLRVFFDCESADSQSFQIKPKKPLCTKHSHTHTPMPITIWPTSSTHCSKHITIHPTPTPSPTHCASQINVPSLIFGTIHPTRSSSSSEPTSASSEPSSAAVVTSATRSAVASSVSSSAASAKASLASVAAVAVMAFAMMLF